MAREIKTRNHELKDIQLFEEGGQYYLKLKYTVEDDARITEVEIPKAKIPFNKYGEPVFNSCAVLGGRGVDRMAECTLSTGYNCEMELCSGETTEANHVFYTVKTISEKRKEMTISEIEKKLGHKIKIVSEK